MDPGQILLGSPEKSPYVYVPPLKTLNQDILQLLLLPRSDRRTLFNVGVSSH